MSETDRQRWKRARGELIERWKEILARIAEHDEGGVLELANVMDEFCDEAVAAREVDSTSPLTTIPTERTEYGERCRFCEGFSQAGGCLGVVEQMNRAVQSGGWERARVLAEGYIQLLRSLDLSAPQSPPSP